MLSMQIKEERAFSSTAKRKVPNVKQANAPLLSMHPPASPLPLRPSGAGANLSSYDIIRLYSPDPPTRFSLVVAPQLPSSSVISPTAAATTPADRDQRHGEAEAKRKQQVWIL
jgi:hypothetical protein